MAGVVLVVFQSRCRLVTIPQVTAVVAVVQVCEQVGVQMGAAIGLGVRDGGSGFAQDLLDLPGPGLPLGVQVPRRLAGGG